jgi:2-oxoisovalerate dehydrogenase E1 component alpha subunit
VKGEESVAVCFFGDGATSEGDTHEAMNIAGVHKLPVVFVCENNGYAISVPAAQQMAVASFADRAAAYGMPGVTINGTDAPTVTQAAHDAIERARRGDGPSVIDARVPRMTPHSSQDDDAYRTTEEKAAAEAADPLVKLRRELLVRGILDESTDRMIIESVRAEVDEAVLRATDQPQPAAERSRQWLYAGDTPHPFLTELEAQGVPEEGSR